MSCCFECLFSWFSIVCCLRHSTPTHIASPNPLLPPAPSRQSDYEPTNPPIRSLDHILDMPYSSSNRGSSDRRLEGWFGCKECVWSCVGLVGLAWCGGLAPLPDYYYLPRLIFFSPSPCVRTRYFPFLSFLVLFCSFLFVFSSVLLPSFPIDGRGLGLRVEWLLGFASYSPVQPFLLLPLPRPLPLLPVLTRFGVYSL